MAGSSSITTDHATIKRWAEERGGKPASVTGTEGDGEAGLLRIDFPGFKGKESLKEITWDEFFDKFEEKNLALLYQEKTSSGGTSRFSKIISRKNQPEQEEKETHKKGMAPEMNNENMQRYEELYSKDINEIMKVAEEKNIPHPDEFNKEELVMAIEIADLEGNENCC